MNKFAVFASVLAVVVAIVAGFVLWGNGASQDVEPSAPVAAPSDFGVSSEPFAPAFEMPLQAEHTQTLGEALRGTFGMNVELPESNISFVDSVTRKFTAHDADFRANFCSGGFAVTDGVQRYAVTAGHCLRPYSGEGNLTMYDYGATRVRVTEAELGVDYALFEHGTITNSVGMEIYGVNPTMKITGVAEPFVGMNVCSYGDTSGWRCGTIISLIGDGSFNANFVSRVGDSGGIIMSGDKVVGIAATIETNEQGKVEYTTGTRADYIMNRTQTRFLEH